MERLAIGQRYAINLAITSTYQYFRKSRYSEQCVATDVVAGGLASVSYEFGFVYLPYT